MQTIKAVRFVAALGFAWFALGLASIQMPGTRMRDRLGDVVELIAGAPFSEWDAWTVAAERFVGELCGW